MEENTRKIRDAISLFENFTGHEAKWVERIVKPKFPSVALRVGKCIGVMYETTRDGKKERYIHEFKKGAAPDLIASFDGKRIFLLGGNYHFTDAGITDR